VPGVSSLLSEERGVPLEPPAYVTGVGATLWGRKIPARRNRAFALLPVGLFLFDEGDATDRI
jgi:hypothetical protein